jgi:hypothetical protein
VNPFDGSFKRKDVRVMKKGLHNQHMGEDINLCDTAFFPCCKNRHWFLFVVDLHLRKIILVDSLRDDNEEGTHIKKINSEEYYIMVIIISLEIQIIRESLLVLLIIVY